MESEGRLYLCLQVHLVSQLDNGGERKVTTFGSTLKTTFEKNSSAEIEAFLTMQRQTLF